MSMDDAHQLLVLERKIVSIMSLRQTLFEQDFGKIFNEPVLKLLRQTSSLSS